MNEVKRLCNSVLMMKNGKIIDNGTPDQLIKKHGRKNLEEVFLKLARNKNEFNRMYGLFLRHFFLITQSFPRILDLNILACQSKLLCGVLFQIFLLSHSTYYNGAVGVILSCAILYDFLFRTSIGFNMLFLEEIWSRNFTNLFISPMKISEIIIIFNFYSFN